MDDTMYYDVFEKNLREALLNLCTKGKWLDGKLLFTDDLAEKWKAIAPEYLHDAVRQVADYPMVSVAWAGYVGMAVAKWWDEDWAVLGASPYSSLYGERGFEDMDEHIMKDILGLDLEGDEAAQLEDLMRQCATTSIGFIRHENIEPQSVRAFHVYARAVKVMFEIGASLELRRLGYQWNKLT